jgi:hypothetical protein
MASITPVHYLVSVQLARFVLQTNDSDNAYQIIVCIGLPFTIHSTGYVICPAKSEWQITLAFKPRLRPFRLLFSKYYFMSILKIWFKTKLPLKIAQRPGQYQSKNQNVICHSQMLSAIAQPQPLCYLPHFYWEEFSTQITNNHTPNKWRFV